MVAVGGTSLYLNADNSYNNETAWGGYSASVGVMIGSGGGTSLYEPEPTYQQGVQSTGFRSTPDVSFVADPNTGVWIADTYNLSAGNLWESVGGTSLSDPCWAGLFALANQARSAAGQPTLNSTTATDAQQALYSLPQADFNSVTSGSNGGYTAQSGYNMATGLGTPVANRLVPDLAAYQQAGDVNTTTPISVGSAASYDTTGDSSTNALATMDVFNALTITANRPVNAYRTAGSAVMPSKHVRTQTVEAALTVPQLSTPAAGSVVTDLAAQSGIAAGLESTALDVLSSSGQAGAEAASIAPTSLLKSPRDAYFADLGTGLASNAAGAVAHGESQFDLANLLAGSGVRTLVRPRT